MATVPTGALERDLRKLFVSWVGTIPLNTGRPEVYLNRFKRQSLALINAKGGEIARRGVSAGFPAPKELDLALVAGHVYSSMELSVIRAQIMSGLNSKESARALLRAGVQKEYYKLERLARTETVRAYWQNQRAESADLGLVTLWSVERGPRTCKWCIERDGLVVDGGVFDHPNGRCTLVSVLPSSVQYRGSVANDGSIYFDDSWEKMHRDVPKAVPMTEAEARPNAGVMWDSPQGDSLLERFWQFHEGSEQTDFMWSDTHEGKRLLMRAIEYLRAGKVPSFTPERAVDKDAWRFYGASADTMGIEGAHSLTAGEVTQAIRSAAQDLMTRQATASYPVMYKGMWVEKFVASQWVEGQVVDLDLSSFASQRNVARRYAKETEGSSHVKDGRAVMFELSNGQGVPIRDAKWDEILVSGKVRVIGVHEDDGILVVRLANV